MIGFFMVLIGLAVMIFPGGGPAGLLIARVNRQAQDSVPGTAIGSVGRALSVPKNYSVFGSGVASFWGRRITTTPLDR